MVEQGTENPRVGSSILSLGTIFFLKPGIPCSGLFSFPHENAPRHDSLRAPQRFLKSSLGKCRYAL